MSEIEDAREEEIANATLRDGLVSQTEAGVQGLNGALSALAAELESH